MFEADKTEAIMDLATPSAETPGTTQSSSRDLLRVLCDNGFDGSLSAAALALGRGADELRALLDGGTAIDEDLVVKMRGLAEQRGIDLGTS